ncbi:MAG TPA: group I intron-associated PD-(D/E)XK endonuclease [Terriglobales bacterium]|nr:group I intron-associated PD-(D/E)XK endonuclease [Terriglobales bacterium]
MGHPKDFRSSDKSVRAARFRNTKRAGERSEAAFLYKAAELGFGVAKPWGDSERYDFIVDNGRRLLRVQVKATDCLRAQAYETRATYTVGKGRAVYSRRDIDFLVAHVVPLDVWYVLPIEACAPAPMLRFYPHREAKQMRLEKYKEAWVLMRENPRAAKTALRSVQGRL